MKLSKFLFAAISSMILLSGPVFAETCCQKAAAEGKECKNKCCIAAHKQDKSCVKCNPNKEDLKLKKTEKKVEKTSKPSKPS